MKEKLVKAANDQPYVNAPLVLVYCKNPSRVKLKFPQKTLTKFAIQDATLAAAYSQLAATALSLSTIWIGMIDEKKSIRNYWDLTSTLINFVCWIPHKTKIPQTEKKPF